MGADFRRHVTQCVWGGDMGRHILRTLYVFKIKNMPLNLLTSFRYPLYSAIARKEEEAVSFENTFKFVNLI